MRFGASIFLGILTLLVFVAPHGVVHAVATTFTVNSTNDADDGTCDSTHCSLREAINAANANSGADTIEFDIPTSDLGFNATTTAFTIRPTSALPTITDMVTIDGYSQSGASPNTNGPGLGLNTVLKIELDETNAGAGATIGLLVLGSSTVRGLAINRFSGESIRSGPANVIEGNFIGTDVTGTVNLGSTFGIVIENASANTIGGTVSGAGNLITGNAVGILTIGTDATANLIQGNFIGTDVKGTDALGNSGSGVLIDGASNNTIGGTTSGTRNVISANGADGVVIGGPSTGNSVQGNFIGTDATGSLDRGNSANGVRIANAHTNTIGGTTAAARNVISGNNQNGVRIDGTSATGNLVQGNLIGTDVTGTAALANSGAGVSIQDDASGNTIGGTTAGGGNTIAFNSGDGAFIFSGTSNAILGNSVFSNSGLGIDLGADGVTANDAGDTDTGANNLQNFPVLVSAQIESGSLFVEYFIDSAFVNSANPLAIEFFVADADAEEGKTLLGTESLTGLTTVLTNLGNAATLGVNAGDSIVATATDPANNTSEFSQSVSVTSSATAIPGLNQWGLVALAVFMAALVAWKLRRKASMARALRE